MQALKLQILAIIKIKGELMKKVKYIFKRIFIIFLIVFFSIILYQFFIEIKNMTENEQIYGTRLSADENEKNNETDISSIIEKASKCVVGISKIKLSHHFF